MFTNIFTCSVSLLLVMGLVFLTFCIVFGYTIDSLVLYRAQYNIETLTDQSLSLVDLLKMGTRILSDKFTLEFQGFIKKHKPGKNVTNLPKVL